MSAGATNMIESAFLPRLASISGAFRIGATDMIKSFFPFTLQFASQLYIPLYWETLWPWPLFLTTSAIIILFDYVDHQSLKFQNRELFIPSYNGPDQYVPQSLLVVNICASHSTILDDDQGGEFHSHEILITRYILDYWKLLMGY